MARARAHSGAEAPKEPHAVSLKVLRLSRPSFSYQCPLPAANTKISPKASLSYPSNEGDNEFILSPNLTLPPTFGSAYVGETFACSLCANNDLPQEESSRVITSVRILAEMQTPSQIFPLELTPPSRELQTEGLGKGESFQQIVRFDLKEEGNHILAVSVSYTETLMADNSQAASGRARTFRKLYQFIAQPCLSVRTKATELLPLEVDNKSLGPYGKSRLLRFALEAQLENVGDGSVVVQQTTLNPKPPFKSRSLNWDFDRPDGLKVQAPLLNPRDVLQVSFLVEQEPGEQDGLDALQKDLKRDGRATLGQLSIEWRSAMGDKGFLTTGNLLTRKR
ncbi:hypothetical protein DTO166G4_8545 [Paecilomyces variotii]|uniref:DUF974 domain protein n=1 Tax=Byssochlamys spectabilis TaxID=264951 RepID=A0A443HZV6_BYSSP|nr:hypothetical protein C8Q69DRAFT_132016 [Paecilomyces variotii]KAJ9192140.1 hypothetical protein DTO032I3_8458 [Paecilomyces variotii]KAJ9209856.1 hypothetical protein DTO166G4_8545 [Paecilomyces variotii]KAJ9229073.1 hypothetical protein DTO166G5_8155 [Paecilomyces variotii]KAJ9243767.1 hypothetical protein DTO169E5_2396 [Paecilomyces variotii]KAJ9247485.1 hypothetical protein DTO207G8_8061 [Paecilomyces variotii]